MNRCVYPYLIVFLFSFAAKAQTNIDTASFRLAMKTMSHDSTNIVVIGESHYSKSTLDGEFFLIKQLNAKGYKKIYFEGGNSEAFILNQFLRTGDTSDLNYTRASERSRTYRQFIDSIYLFNKNYNAGIYFEGFDFERPLCVGYLFSNWFKDATIDGLDMKTICDSIVSIGKHPARDLYTVSDQSLELDMVLDTLRNTFIELEEQYKKILNGNFPVFKQIVFNPVYALFKKNDFFSTRDPFIIQSFLKKSRKANLGQSIIITGSDHETIKKHFVPALADRLPDKYSFFCFVFVYFNCRQYDNERVTTSRRKLKRYLNKNDEGDSVMNFKAEKKHVVPSQRKNLQSIVVGDYNQ